MNPNRYKLDNGYDPEEEPLIGIDQYTLIPLYTRSKSDLIGIIKQLKTIISAYKKHDVRRGESMRNINNAIKVYRKRLDAQKETIKDILRMINEGKDVDTDVIAEELDKKYSSMADSLFTIENEHRELSHEYNSLMQAFTTVTGMSYDEWRSEKDFIKEEKKRRYEERYYGQDVARRGDNR